MESELRDYVGELLDSGDVAGVLALKDELGAIKPYLFTKNHEIGSMVLTSKYPLASVMTMLQKEDPSIKLAMVCRGCDERALIELAKRNQINMDNITFVGIPCDEEMADKCNCLQPYPKEIVVGEKLSNWVPKNNYEDFKNMSTEEKLTFWKGQLEKCNKCYGCRNVCPLCFCTDCELENALWVKHGRLPPEFPIYHVIRAFHLAGKCVGCGECENACPVGIPLMTLNHLLRDDIKDLFGYMTGQDIEDENPINTKEEY